MNDQFFSSFTDEMMNIKTAAVSDTAAKTGLGWLSSGAKSFKRFGQAVKGGFQGKGVHEGLAKHLPKGVDAKGIGKGIGGAWQAGKASLRRAASEEGRRGLGAAATMAAVPVGVGAAGYVGGKLSSPNVVVNRGY
jgi:hypothetical protein